jgi:dihydrofolate reductase
MSKRINIIVAASKNNVIGNESSLPWHIPTDLKNFKKLTTGHTVIMGRKTYESIGKPLPNRTNIIITRNKEFKANGCIICHSLNDALLKSVNNKDIFIIGGCEIYLEALEIADKIYLTRILCDAIGDISLPDDFLDGWELETESETYEEMLWPFKFTTYIK